MQYKYATLSALVLALGVTAAPTPQSDDLAKRETDWAYFCNDKAGTQGCGEGVAMSNYGCNLVEGGRESLSYSQNAAEYYLGSFTDSSCSTLKTFYDVNPGAVASTSNGVIGLNPADQYYGFCAVSFIFAQSLLSLMLTSHHIQCSGCTDVTSGTGACQ